MFRFHISMLVALVVATISVSSAEDYVVPDGVTVLTEEQLLKQAVGNTFMNDRWTEYWEPPASNEKKGKSKGKFRGTAYGGGWEVKKSLICFHWDLASLAKYNGICYMIALDGVNATWYNTDGSTYYPRGGRIKMSNGNPNNF